MAERYLTDICDIQYGFAFDSSCFTPSAEEGMPLVRIRDVMNGRTETYFKGDYPKEYIIHKGDFLIGMDGEFNIAPWQSEDALLNQRVCRITSNQWDASTKYLYWFLKKELKRIEDETPFVTVKHLSAKRLKQVKLEVPTIQEQDKIVAELDCLSEVIAMKKQQLGELDKLAQSIFYDMFGDPIANERGWDYQRLGDVSQIIGGATPKTQIEAFWTGDNYWVTPAELHGNRYQGATERTISDEAVRKTNVNLLPTGTVLLSSRAPIGKVSITTVPMYCNQGFKNIVCSSKLNNEYVCQALLSKTEYLNSLGTGATFKEISKKTTEAIRIAIPPIDLQKEFAIRVKSIDRQKELIKQSIAETETLFNSRMEYYFGG